MEHTRNLDPCYLVVDSPSLSLAPSHTELTVIRLFYTLKRGFLKRGARKEPTAETNILLRRKQQHRCMIY